MGLNINEIQSGKIYAIGNDMYIVKCRVKNGDLAGKMLVHVYGFDDNGKIFKYFVGTFEKQEGNEITINGWGIDIDSCNEENLKKFRQDDTKECINISMADELDLPISEVKETEEYKKKTEMTIFLADIKAYFQMAFGITDGHGTITKKAGEVINKD